MKDQTRLGTQAPSKVARGARLALAALAIVGGAGAAGCLNRPIEPIQPLITSVVVEELTQSGVNKIDLVLAVDNSASMADKQQILALAVPDLITGLVNPKCLDNTTMNPVASQPSLPTAACPTGSTREFPPVLDIHIGLISSSLGSFGSPGCPDTPPASCPTADTTPQDDHGHLVTRSDACDSKGPVPTFNNEGFLAWDPSTGAPAGSIGTIGAIGTSGFGSGSGLVGAVHDLVVGNGQAGCGFESQDESWYRFLVDPDPYGSIMLNGASQVVTSGTDNVLLTQRKEFMRPDSLLAIVVLSDETDTSVKEFSSYPLFTDPNIHLPHASSQCAAPVSPTTGPNDPCCYSCGESAPKGCTADPKCTSAPDYTSADEVASIRAFGLIHHKAAYGIEFFYQPSRYVSALTSQTVSNSIGTMVPNPIYTNLDPTHYTGAVRDSSLVFYAAIVGVPWQLVARQNASGQPDLINGVSKVDPTQVGGFKTAAELSLTDPKGNIFWDDIAGDPEHYIIAKSPFMVESTTPRSGTDPITGAAISPVTTANGAGSKSGTSKNNLLNDHERTLPNPPNDIEYACIFPLVTPVDESAGGPNANTGDCYMAPTDNPLCSPNPNDSGKNTLQTSAKAYPGIKQLAIARGMNGQGIAASICPAQLGDSTAADFGYRPAVKAIIDRLKQALHGECLPRQLTEDPKTGKVNCLILEGTKVANPDTDCGCTGTARAKVPDNQSGAVTQAEADPAASKNGLNCFCEITQLCNEDPTDPTNTCTDPAGKNLTSCQSDPMSTADGWCYIDAAASPAQATLVETVAKCPADNPHNIRFLGAGNAVAGSVLFITCSGD